MKQLETISKVLELLGNSHTKIKCIENVKGNYYSYLTDTIYISENENMEAPDKKGLNPLSGRLVTFCHECIHSVQNKFVQALNTIFSNLSILAFAIIVLLKILRVSYGIFPLICIGIFVVAIAVREYLEINAIIRSKTLAKFVIQKKTVPYVSVKDIDDAWQYAKKLLPAQIVYMISDKLIMIMLTVLIINI